MAVKEVCEEGGDMGQWFKKIAEQASKDKKKTLLCVILFGIIVLVIMWPVSDSEKEKEDTVSEENISSIVLNGELSSGMTVEAYVEEAQKRLSELLGGIAGAGRVQVMITAKATRERVIGKDVSESVSHVQESDSNGGTRLTQENSREESVIYDKNGGEGSLYVIKEYVPEIEGVVVSAQGGGNPAVADEITQAVSVLFNLPVHKIKVVEMEH